MPIKLKITKTPATAWFPLDIVRIQCGDVSFSATSWIYSDQSGRGMLPKVVFSNGDRKIATLTGDAAIQFDEWDNP